MVDLGIAGPVQKCHEMASSELAKLGERRIAPQLRDVAPPKFRKPLRLVAKPLPQRWTRCDVLHPGREACVGFFQASGPETVDQDPKTIVGARGLIDALDLKGHPGRLALRTPGLCHPSARRVGTAASGSGFRRRRAGTRA